MAEEDVWHQEFAAWRSRNYVYSQAQEALAYAEQAYLAACRTYASRLRAAVTTADVATANRDRALREWHVLHQRLDDLEAAAGAVLRDPTGVSRGTLVQLLQAPRPISPELTGRRAC